MYEFDWSVVPKYLPYLIKTGLVMTLQLSVLSIVFGIIIGVVAGLGRISTQFLIRAISSVYVEWVRGTPLLVLLFFIYYGIGVMFDIAPFLAAILGLSIFAGAYVAEIVRAGIQSIHKGQMLAARSQGMTHIQAMRYIILPQAFKRILPPLAGQFISLIKDSSLVSVLAITELTYAARKVETRSFRSFEIWITVAIMYFLMTYTLSLFVQYLERRAAVSD